MHHREDFQLSAHKLTGLFPICLNLTTLRLQRLLSHPNSDDKATCFVLPGGSATPGVDSEHASVSSNAESRLTKSKLPSCFGFIASLLRVRAPPPGGRLFVFGTERLQRWHVAFETVPGMLWFLTILSMFFCTFRAKGRKQKKTPAALSRMGRH